MNAERCGTGSSPWLARLLAGRLAFIACALLPLAALADGQHTFWEISGRHNKVWLFGSVHVLPDADSALPAVATQAYADAETIVEELDMNAAIVEMSGSAGIALQMLPQGQTLERVLGPELYARVKQEAGTLGMDLDFMTRLQPWALAMQIQSLRLLRAGYNPLVGVDMQIANWALRDGKPLKGLETLAEQLSVFATMSLDQQREFLRGTLEQPDTEEKLGAILDAWRNGKVDVLATALREGAEESPELFHQLTTVRNLRWLPQLEKMLQDPKDDYLVVTGALHMVGSDGLVDLLRRKGYKVEQK